MIYDIAIVGSGPGGYVSAIRAAQLGASVVLIEKADLGGTCLNRGCIPTKAMLASIHCLHAVQGAKKLGVEVPEFSLNVEKVYERQKNLVAQMRKGLQTLLKTYKSIDVMVGEASIVSSSRLLVRGETAIEVEARNIIIATGSECASFAGLEVDHQQVINSDDALNLEEFPASIIIIGAGAIGIEWSRIFSAAGVEVTLLEALDRIAPACDQDISNVALKDFKRSRVKVKTGVKVSVIDKAFDHVVVTLEDGETCIAEKVLLAAGRKPNSALKGLTEAGVMLERGFIKTDDFMQTACPNIYAIGDVVGRFPLAHVASCEGIMVVEKILGHYVQPINYTHVPFVIYGTPELAGVGMTEEQAKTANIDVETGIFYYAANGRAIAESVTVGLVKSIIDKKTEKIIGVHVAGENASDIIHQGVLAVVNGLTKKDFSTTIFAHPTLSEAFHESILKLHVPGKVSV